MDDATTFVGLDVHVRTITIAIARDAEAPVGVGTIANVPEALAAKLRKLGEAHTLHVCYEAGPCGYAIHRQLTKLGMACMVVAPSLIPVRPGDRVKTDRRDAEKLAGLLRSGALTAVAVPSEEQEALRDLSRVREQAVRDQQRARQRLLKFVLQHGIAEPTLKTRWTREWWAWAQALTLTQPASQLALDDLRETVTTATTRLKRVTQALSAQAKQGELAPVIAAFQHLHGVGFVTAVGIVAEVGDLTRFETPGQLFAYAGLVPGEHSSGERIRRSGIMHTGNRHLRFLLIEAAWHSARARKPRKSPPASVFEQIAERNAVRLNRRFARFVSRGKPRQVAIVAVARELLGACRTMAWAVKTEQAG